MAQTTEAVELAIVTAVLSEPTLFRDTVTALLPGHFGSVEARNVWSAILTVAAEAGGGTISAAAVADRLKARGAKVPKVTDTVTDPAALAANVAVLQNHKAVADAIGVLGNAIPFLEQGEPTAEDVARLGTRLVELANLVAVERGGPVALEDLWAPWAESLEAGVNGESTASPPIPTKFRNLDRQLGGGLWRGSQVVVGGRPSMGKTSFALTLALGTSYGGYKGLFLSLEMAEKQLIGRAVSQIMGLDHQRIRSHNLSRDELRQAISVAQQLGDLPLHIDDTRGRNIQQVLTTARRHHRQHGLDVLYLDYLQLLRVKGDRFLGIGEAAKLLRDLAQELDCAVVVLAQLNREAADLRNGATPRLHHFRETGDIEQDTDVALFPWRTEYQDGKIMPAREPAEIIIAKQREGPTGVVPAWFQGPLMLYSERDA